MAKVIVDIPDDFKNKLVYISSQQGKTIKFQILEALAAQWEWPKSRMPKDGRFRLLDMEDPEIQTGGQTPRGKVPLDKEGLHDFEPVHHRMEAAENFMRGRTTDPKPDDDDYGFLEEFDDEPSSGPAVHPDDVGKKIPTGTEGKDKMLTDLQRKIEEEF